jgi:hypothetical protein
MNLDIGSPESFLTFLACNSTRSPGFSAGGCMYFRYSHGPLDIHYVDADGNEISAEKVPGRFRRAPSCCCSTGRSHRPLSSGVRRLRVADLQSGSYSKDRLPIGHRQAEIALEQSGQILCVILASECVLTKDSNGCQSPS